MKTKLPEIEKEILDFAIDENGNVFVNNKRMMENGEFDDPLVFMNGIRIVHGTFTVTDNSWMSSEENLSMTIYFENGKILRIKFMDDGPGFLWIIRDEDREENVMAGISMPEQHATLSAYITLVEKFMQN